jgi:phenylalanyl-tRNA synthetase beta chain
MLFSFSLLSELVDLSGISPEKLAHDLTFAQFEVEGMHQVAQASKLCIGHVLSCEKHPDSDHLHVLKVDCGQEGVLDIVCGAPNVAKGQKVIVALVGCVLPAIGETIQSGVIRGQASNGMCCSLSELGVDKSAQSEEDLKGIHVLPEDAPVGERNVLAYLGLDDTILDVNVLPNRSDCLSHFGFAREIASVENRPLKFSVSSELPKEKSGYEVTSLTPSCDKFFFAEVALKDGKTPEKVVRTLRNLGLRSVSPAVDLGNYAMILTGQPFHMYDLDKVEGKKLTVSDSYEGKFVALTGKEYDLLKGDIVISDDKKVCCLGGVMGGKSVEVEKKTTHVGIEAAHFYFSNIRHTSNRLGLVSDSSSLFIKGTNPYTVEESMNEILSLASLFFKDVKILGTSSYDKTAPQKTEFAFSYEKLNARLGAHYPKEVIDDVLKRIGASYSDGKVARNKYRMDLNEQCDIDEEVFRLAPQEYIVQSIDKLPVTHGELTDKQAKVRKVENFLIDQGLDQIVTYTLVSKKQEEGIRVFSKDPSYAVLHPLTEEHKYVRSDLLESMAQALQYNLDRKSGDLGLFEVSEIHTPKGNHTYLSIGLCGNKKRRGMLESSPYDFFDIKGYFTSLSELLGVSDKRYTLVRSKNPAFHPGRSADVLFGKTVVATFGETNPASDKKGMILLEMDLGAFILTRSSRLKIAPTPVFNPVRRDLAFTLEDAEVTAAQIEKQIRKAGGKYVSDVEVFDSFTKDGRTSLAFALELYREDRSFKDEEINSLLNTIILDVTHSLKVSLRQ